MKRPPAFALRIQLSAVLAVATAAFGLPTVLSPTVAQAAATCSWTPMKSSSGARYRVPSVVQGADGRLFVFAERRNNNYDNDDEGDFDISMATSTDDGCTWSAPQVVASHGSSRVSNPVPVYVPAVNKVLLLSTLKVRDSSTSSGYRHTLRQQWISADGSEVTPTGIGDSLGWPGMSGTGHAIVLSKGADAGRIVVALGSTNSSGKRVPRSLVSDDNGQTWRIGWEQASPGKLKLIEGTVAELTDGSLLASYRDKGDGVASPGANRVSAVSTDAGESLATTFRAMSGVKTVPTGGSLLQLTGYSDLLLFSSPSNTSGTLKQRKGMRIFISTDQGHSWKKGLAVGSSTDPAYYSDLVQLDQANVGIAYESGYGSGKKYWHKIAFKKIPIADLNESLLPTLAKKKSPTVSGTHKVGRTVSAKQGTWSPSVTVISYQWLRNGKAISAATASTYKPTKADKGKKLSVKITVTSPGYQKATATSSGRKVK